MLATIKSIAKQGCLLLSQLGRTLRLPPFQAKDGFITRELFLSEIREASVLEIGPFDRPVVQGPNVKYFDVLDRTALIQRASALGRNPEGCPTIHYVSNIGDLSVIQTEKFDCVVSSHCVEHQPDLIAHLNQVYEILKPGGRYCLLIPDKRFTFDHYIAPSRASDLLAAHLERRTAHTNVAALAHRADTTHNIPWRHWLGLHRAQSLQPYAKRLELAMQEVTEAAAHGDFLDVHAWFLTPVGFGGILNTLLELKLTRFIVTRIYGTAFASGEFFAILSKQAALTAQP